VKKVDLSGRPLHFIGVGGIGMSALAQIVVQRRLPVSGSDIKSNHITKRLESLGTKIFYSQDAANLELISPSGQNHAEINDVEINRKIVSVASPSAAVSKNSKTTTVLRESRDHQSAVNSPQVICSTAIAESNPEYQAALKFGYPIFHRSDLLAALIDQYQSIAVSGTHGKTTTSSLVGYVLMQAGLDPTIIIGGEVDAWQGNARAGQGEYLVAEADESDGSLIKHAPAIGIITNIELDHPDKYSSLDEVIKVFQIFAQQCGLVIGCLDDQVLKDNIPIDISYSLDAQSNADYIAREITYYAQGVQAQIWERGKLLGSLDLQLLGNHNLSNALAAIAVGRKVGLEFSVIAEALATFSGTKRRFELKGEANEIKFIDDYAHHPSEIKVTLESARIKTQESESKRVVAIFQPHRFSRTKTFLAEFAESFQDADVVIITSIYSAGETNLSKISGKDLAEKIRDRVLQTHYLEDLSSIPKFLKEDILRPGDLTLFLGAGNLNQYIEKTIELYQE